MSEAKDRGLDSSLLRSLTAGALAGCTVEGLLYPLDRLKTRLQAKCVGSSGSSLSYVYKGLPVVLLGNSIGSAVFFGTYEQSKALLHHQQGCWESLLADSASAVLGELAACVFRTPTEILKQRMQAHGVNVVDGMRGISLASLSTGFRATASRDLLFSALQFPAYEKLKQIVSRDSRQLSPWEAALCGSATGSITAVFTTPLDVVKTRVMLSKEDACQRSAGVCSEIATIYRVEGVRGFFHGGICRAVWMGLGGLLFLGSYEKVKTLFNSEGKYYRDFSGGYASCASVNIWGIDRGSDPLSLSYRRCWYTSGNDQNQNQDTLKQAVLERSGYKQDKAKIQQVHTTPTALTGVGVELLAGGIAGCTVDASLYPIDTLKTRQQAWGCFWKEGALAGTWRGVSVPLIASIPASGIFWAVYVPLKSELWLVTGSNTTAEIPAATLSEMVSLVVRVPAEVIKQRMQARVHQGSVSELVNQIYAREGVRGFYAGSVATCYRSVPFALVQFPVYEEVKRRIHTRYEKTPAWWTGAASGALAGSVAAVLTTPLDVVKTRIMLAPPETRLGFYQTLQHIVSSRPAALFGGVVPRALHLGFGGMIYLGAYNGVSDYLRTKT